MLEPLHELLRQLVPWHWGESQRETVKAIKAYLQSEPLLVHHDVTKPIVVSCDASPYGIGAVLSHVDSDGLEHPVAFASRKLASAERNYSQLDKEGLALVFAVKKFHKYLSGREFALVTDHRPLLGLLGENKPIPQQASPRLQHWTLAGYDCRLLYRKGSENGNADCLSSLPLPQAAKDVPLVADIHQVGRTCWCMCVSESDQDLDTSWSSDITGVWVCDVWVSGGNSHYQSSETILAAQVWVECGGWCLVVGESCGDAVPWSECCVVWVTWDPSWCE